MKILLTSALLVSVIAFSSFSAAIEKPEYKVVFVDGAVECSLYQSFIVADAGIIDL
jgi:hypothetical protein